MTVALSVLAISAGTIVSSPPVVAAPISITGTTVNYTVKPGDSIVGIALKHKVKVSALLNANGLTLSSAIHPGQTLQIPTATAPSGTVAGPTTHTVKAGDYLTGIAARYHVTTSALLKANGFTLASVIMPGQVLTLPAGAQAPTTTGGSSGGGQAGGATSGGVSTLTHTVRAGDFLTGIAAKYSVRTTDLLAVNGITLTSVIMPGQVLKLPANAKAPSAPPSGTVSSGNAKIDKVVNYALAQVGKPYEFFKAGPASFDCSGLALAAYKQIGITLPHHALSQSKLGVAVDWTTQPIKPGDLIFMLSSRHPTDISHMGIAISATEWVQAPRTGDVVRVGKIPMWKIVAVRRLVD